VPVYMLIVVAVLKESGHEEDHEGSITLR
jgi:hypothetical protein